MPKGDWEHLRKACARETCDGELLGKALGQRNFALRCTHCDFQKRGTIAQITDWLSKN